MMAVRQTNETAPELTDRDVHQFLTQFDAATEKEGYKTRLEVLEERYKSRGDVLAARVLGALARCQAVSGELKIAEATALQAYTCVGRGASALADYFGLQAYGTWAMMQGQYGEAEEFYSRAQEKLAMAETREGRERVHRWAAVQRAVAGILAEMREERWRMEALRGALGEDSVYGKAARLYWCLESGGLHPSPEGLGVEEDEASSAPARWGRGRGFGFENLREEGRGWGDMATEELIRAYLGYADGGCHATAVLAIDVRLAWLEAHRQHEELRVVFGDLGHRTQGCAPELVGARTFLLENYFRLEKGPLLELRSEFVKAALFEKVPAF